MVIKIEKIKNVGAQPGNKNAIKNDVIKRKPRSYMANDEEYIIIQTNAQNAKISISEFIRNRCIPK